MAYNPNQPSYGFSFQPQPPPAQQQMVPPSPTAPYNGYHDPRMQHPQQPPSSGYNYNASLPPVDMQSTGASAAQYPPFFAQLQQSFPQGAWPPPLPHAGQHAIPPPQPPFTPTGQYAFPPSPFGPYNMPPPPATQNGWHNPYISQHGSPAGPTALHARVAEVMDVDREDGEVRESDKTTKTVEQAAAQPAADSSSNFRPHFVMNEFGSGHSGGKLPAQSDIVSNGTSLPASRAGHVDNMSQLIAERRRETLDFILFLKRANIGYDSVSREVSHFERHLRDAYDELGISSADELKLVTSSLEERLEAPQTDTQKAPATSQAQDALAATGASKPIDTVPHQPGTLDRAQSDKAANPAVSRESYIQRLLAAKSSKPAVSVATRSTSGSVPASPAEKPAPSQDSKSMDKEEGKISAGSLPTQITKDGENASATAAAAAATAAALAEQKRKTQTELAKKKMEALRASTAARRANAEPTAPGERPLSGNAEITMANTPFLPTAGALPKDSQNAAANTTGLGALPGLFIAPSPTENSHVYAPTGQQQVGRTATPGKARKRPVAADFDDMEIEPTETASKRSFGQARHEYADEPMVIEVSDDETVDSTKGHDADDRRAILRAVDSVTTPGSTFPRTVRPGLPTLTNFPAAPDFSQPDSLTASAAQTPSGLATPGATAKEEELKRKNNQIQALKAKIAAAQQKRRQEQQMSSNQVLASSQPQQPSGSLASAFPTAVTAPGASGIAASDMTTNERTAEVPRGTDFGTPRRALDSSLISPSPGPASNDPVWRKRRRQEIESGLPALDASLASNNFKLAQMKLEMQRLEAENQQRIADKENLIKELEDLGIDTEGMPHEELQARKDEILQAVDEVVDAAGGLNAGHMRDPSPLRQDRVMAQVAATGEAHDADGGVSLDLAQDELERPATHAEMPATIQVPPVLAKPTSDLLSQTRTLHEDRFIDAAPTRRDSGEVTDGLGDDMDLSDADSDKEDEPQALQVAQPLPEVTQLVDDTASTVQDNESLDDVYSPDSANGHLASTLDPGLEAADESEYNPLTPSAADESEFNPENDGSSMPTAAAAEIITQDPAPAPHVEDEEEYEPSEDGEIDESASPSQHVGPALNGAGRSVVPGLQMPDQELQDTMAVEADAADEYEPVEEPPLDLQQDDARMTETAVAFAPSAAPYKQVDEIKLDIPDVPELLSEFERTNEPTSATGSNTPASSVAPLTFITDDLAPELNDVQEDSLAHVKPDKTPSSHTPRFTSYESPLRAFKAYRYHPQYKDQVTGGYRSLTYSHQINDSKPLCQYEAAGGTCNDPQCEGQHFKTMGLSDDLILVQLGTQNPGQTDEEKQRWTDGLRLILRELRSRNTKDPDVVATEIARYRREFLRDPSKILNL